MLIEVHGYSPHQGYRNLACGGDVIRSAVPQSDEERIARLEQQLYTIERQAPDGRDVMESGRNLRTKESREIIGEIHSWALQTKALGESLLRKAVEYMGSLWKGLRIFLDDPKVDIHHNDVERGITRYGCGSKKSLQIQIETWG